MLRYFKLLILFLLLQNGCGSYSVSPARVDHLSRLLQGLDKTIPNAEAERLSRDIYQKTKSLSEEFKPVSPPQFHNFLVNIGLKQKGLCYHWSDALYLHLNSRGYEYFDFHLLVDHIGEYWSEHNAVAVTTKSCTSDECIEENAIVIDAWRDSGRLYVMKITEDTQYRWKHRIDRCR
jgi:hypothetical protein